MHDPVNSPSHYAQWSIECIEGIQASMSKEAFKGYLKGNCQKYLWRYENKNGKEDLLKCQWYLNRLIKAMEEDEAFAHRAEDAVNEAFAETKEPSDPDAYMISGSTSIRQGPPEPWSIRPPVAPLGSDDCRKSMRG
jgi:hypothetical protein